MPYKVCIAGATGWSGSALAKAIFESDDCHLVGAVSRSHASKKLGAVLNVDGMSVPISSSVSEAIQTPTDVLVELTKPEAAKSHVITAINAGIHVVIGTSGLVEDDFQEIHNAALAKNVGVIAAGNFSITAILLEKFAVEAARYLPSWEIIDYASSKKPDAPSGVSRELAFRVSEVRKPVVDRPIENTIGPKESRGATFDGSQIHSIRLPGYTISLEIIFGAEQERLTLRHDAGTSADPYVQGALLAIRKVNQHVGLIRGLDRLL
jgi:4-hydroxy-tetrahydrodipicolinate reductase